MTATSFQTINRSSYLALQPPQCCAYHSRHQSGRTAYLWSETPGMDTYFGVFPRIKDKNFYKQTVKYGALARYLTSTASPMPCPRGNSNVYAYRFDWDEEPSQYGFDLSLALGAAHVLKSFVFGDFENRLFSSLYQTTMPRKRFRNP